MPFYTEADNYDNFNLFCNGEDAEDLYGLFAKSYCQAASILAESLLTKEHGFRQYEAYPVVFLYRHCFELYLKNILFKSDKLADFKGIPDMPGGKRDGHDIVKLSEMATATLRKLFPKDESLEKVTKNMLRTAAEFKDMAPAADWYRYPETNQVNDEIRPKPRIANLGSFHANLKTLTESLDTIDFGFNVTTALAELDREWESATDEDAREKLRQEYPWKFGGDKTRTSLDINTS